MIRTLQDKGVHSGIEVYMELTIFRLLKDAGKIAGAIGYWRKTGLFVVFKTKAIVLATGGGGKAYPITSNSWECTGDGHALAYETGAELIDMEFFQFHPTGMVWPPGVKGLLVTEGVRGEGGLLTNNKGERFMQRYDPKMMELSTRDRVARSIYTEVKEGRGSPHGGVFLDISHLPPERVKKKLPSMYHQFKELADVDITKEPMEVGPTAHYMMGGVRVDAETGLSTIPGLFACGEVTGGMHGANRLGGNSLSDLVVFGRRAGIGAAEYARKLNSFPTLDQEELEKAAKEMEAPFQRSGDENPYQIHRELQESMQSLVGIFRTEEDLKKGINKIEELKHRTAKVAVKGGRVYNPGWHLVGDLKSLLIASEAVAKAAQARKESRGAHSRLDYPNLDEKLGKLNVVVSQKAAEMNISTSPVPEMPEELKKLLAENK
jgi:succinate dehydrogenase / fumarate reductase flavoprotein subunit